ncbi:hypothetical protein BJ165DRAFT_1128226 [Panaeolus papilionaceus]|nr:hypothetical protein BJ165DRAFT_1128226 [Panaeolus papilionaceus]
MHFEGEEVDGDGGVDGRSYHPPVSSPTSTHPHTISQPPAQRSPEVLEIVHSTWSQARQATRTQPQTTSHAHQYSQDSSKSSTLGQPSEYPSPIASTHTTIAPRLISPTSSGPSNSRFLGGYGAVVGGVVAAAGKGSGLAQAIRRGGVGFGLSQGGHTVPGGIHGEGPYEYGERGGVEEDSGATVRGVPATSAKTKTFSSSPSLAKRDSLNAQRVLLLGYNGGVRIHNCGNFSGLEEVLNIRFSLEDVSGKDGEGKSTEVGTGRETEREVRITDVGVLKDPSRRALDHARAHGVEVDGRVGPLLGVFDELVGPLRLQNGNRDSPPSSIAFTSSFFYRPSSLVSSHRRRSRPSTPCPNEHWSSSHCPLPKLLPSLAPHLTSHPQQHLHLIYHPETHIHLIVFATPP